MGVVAIRLVRCAIVGLGLSTVAGSAAAQTSPTDTLRSAAAGVFTTAQADAGETVFKTVCSSCHTNSQFMGPQFQRGWSGRQVFSLFDQLRTTMPMDNPGGLGRAEYIAVVAYILKLNAYPAGASELPDDDDALKLIRFDTVNAGSQR